MAAARVSRMQQQLCECRRDGTDRATELRSSVPAASCSTSHRALLHTQFLPFVTSTTAHSHTRSSLVSRARRLVVGVIPQRARVFLRRLLDFDPRARRVFLTE